MQPRNYPCLGFTPLFLVGIAGGCLLALVGCQALKDNAEELGPPVSESLSENCGWAGPIQTYDLIAASASSQALMLRAVLNYNPCGAKMDWEIRVWRIDAVTGVSEESHGLTGVPVELPEEGDLEVAFESAGTELVVDMHHLGVYPTEEIEIGNVFSLADGAELAGVAVDVNQYEWADEVLQMQ